MRNNLNWPAAAGHQPFRANFTENAKPMSTDSTANLPLAAVAHYCFGEVEEGLNSGMFQINVLSAACATTSESIGFPNQSQSSIAPSAQRQSS
jgi:hypothetical protein